MRSLLLATLLLGVLGLTAASNEIFSLGLKKSSESESSSSQDVSDYLKLQRKQAQQFKRHNQNSLKLGEQSSDESDYSENNGKSKLNMKRGEYDYNQGQQYNGQFHGPPPHGGPFGGPHGGPFGGPYGGPPGVPHGGPFGGPYGGPHGGPHGGFGPQFGGQNGGYFSGKQSGQFGSKSGKKFGSKNSQSGSNESNSS